MEQRDAGRRVAGGDGGVGARENVRAGARAAAGFGAKALPIVVSFLGGLLLAQGTVFSAATPFGVGYAAAFGSRGWRGAAACAGAALGALYAWRLGDGLKYFAACLLVLVAVKAFGGTSVLEKRWFAPAVAGGSLVTVGFVFVAAEGFAAGATATYVSEVALAAAAALVLPMSLEQTKGEQTARMRNMRAAARLAGAAIVLLCLASAELFAGLTIGRTAAALLALAAASGGGLGAGAAAGVAFGLIFDAQSGGAFYTLCLGAAGLLAGVMSGGPKLACAAAFSLTAAACALIDGERFSALYEVFIASTVFVAIPEGKLRIADFLLPEEVGSTADVERARLRERARAMSELMSDAARTLRASASPHHASADKVYLRASARVCKGCALRALCWERERAATFENMQKALERAQPKGRADADDLPPAFRTRCMHSEEFAAALGEELRVYQLERRRMASDARHRELAAARYAATAGALSEAAGELAAGLEWQGAAQTAARRALNACGVSAEVRAWRYPGGRLALHVAASKLADAAVCSVESALSTELRPPRPCEGGVLLLERGKFEVRAGSAGRKRRGSPRSGDCGVCFETDDGKFFCVLADGMGSGEDAAAESAHAVRTAQRLLKVGVGPMRTAEQVAALAAERGGDVFATLDIFMLDMQSGRSEFVKNGAAASFVLSNGRAVRYDAAGEPAKAVRLAVRGGADCVVMASDGVSADGRWVEELIERFDLDGGEPKELARAIADEAARRTDESDDILVVAMVVG